jgi:hypothetical protein
LPLLLPGKPTALQKSTEIKFYCTIPYVPPVGSAYISIREGKKKNHVLKSCAFFLKGSRITKNLEIHHGGTRKTAIFDRKKFAEIRGLGKLIPDPLIQRYKKHRSRIRNNGQKYIIYYSSLAFINCLSREDLDTTLDPKPTLS